MTFPKRSGQTAQTIVPKVQRLAFNTTENACCEKIVEGLHIGGRLSLLTCNPIRRPMSSGKNEIRFLHRLSDVRDSMLAKPSNQHNTHTVQPRVSYKMR